MAGDPYEHLASALELGNRSLTFNNQLRSVLDNNRKSPDDTTKGNSGDPVRIEIYDEIGLWRHALSVLPALHSKSFIVRASARFRSAALGLTIIRLLGRRVAICPRAYRYIGCGGKEFDTSDCSKRRDRQCMSHLTMKKARAYAPDIPPKGSHFCWGVAQPPKVSTSYGKQWLLQSGSLQSRRFPIEIK